MLPVRKPLGKWNDLSYLQNPWKFRKIISVKGRKLCMMCESRWCKYLHFMEGVVNGKKVALAVGCICAGNLEGDIQLAKRREEAFIKKIAKKNRFIKGKWKVSYKKNRYKKIDGFLVTVFPNRYNNKKFDCSIEHLKTGEKIYFNNFLSQEQAALEAYKYIRY